MLGGGVQVGLVAQVPHVQAPTVDYGKDCAGPDRARGGVPVRAGGGLRGPLGAVVGAGRADAAHPGSGGCRIVGFSMSSAWQIASQTMGYNLDAGCCYTAHLVVARPWPRTP